LSPCTRARTLGEMARARSLDDGGVPVSPETRRPYQVDWLRFQSPSTTRVQIQLSVARVSHGVRRPYACRLVIWVVEAAETSMGCAVPEALLGGQGSERRDNPS
jgi:hypothetical protein